MLFTARFPAVTMPSAEVMGFAHPAGCPVDSRLALLDPLMWSKQVTLPSAIFCRTRHPVAHERPPGVNTCLSVRECRVYGHTLRWIKESYESNAMWQLYSNKGKGVAIVTSPRKIVSSIAPYRIKPEYGEESLYGGDVKYVNLLEERLKVNMLERFYYKHLAFSWEKEFRLAISVRGAEEAGVNVPERGIHVEAKMSELIEHIFFGPNLADEEKKEIMGICAKHNITDKVI